MTFTPGVGLLFQPLAALFLHSHLELDALVLASPHLTPLADVTGSRAYSLPDSVHELDPLALDPTTYFAHLLHQLP